MFENVLYMILGAILLNVFKRFMEARKQSALNEGTLDIGEPNTPVMPIFPKPEKREEPVYCLNVSLPEDTTANQITGQLLYYISEVGLNLRLRAIDYSTPASETQCQLAVEHAMFIESIQPIAIQLLDNADDTRLSDSIDKVLDWWITHREGYDWAGTPISSQQYVWSVDDGVRILNHLKSTLETSAKP